MLSSHVTHTEYLLSVPIVIEMYCLSLTGRYVAPEVFRNEEYDTKVDVFSFALILQEVKYMLIIFLVY